MKICSVEVCKWHQFVIIITCSDNVCPYGINFNTRRVFFFRTATLIKEWLTLLKHLNFLLNELHKRTIGIVFIQREISSRKKKYLHWGTPTDTQERFYFPYNNLTCISWILVYYEHKYLPQWSLVSTGRFHCNRL